MSVNIKKTKKYFKVGYKKIVNFLATEIFLHTGFWLPKPLKVYYLITNKCNYQCAICPQWRNGLAESPAGYFDEEDMRKVINEMSALGIGELGISGGEPLLYQDKLFKLLADANKKGIYTHFVTNGSLLTEEVLKKYDSIGGGHISLSIDAIGDLHDELRGAGGAYENIARILTVFRKNKYENIILKINFTLTNANLEQAVPVVKLAIAHKALIFIQPYDTYSYGRKNVADKQAEFPLWVKKENYALLARVMRQLMELKKSNPDVILNGAKHLAAVYDYFTDSRFATRCLAAFDQIAINPQGKIIFCKFGIIGDLRQQSLGDFLKSRKRKETVRESLRCRDGCLLGCMTRPSLYDLFVNGSRQFLKLISL